MVKERGHRRHRFVRRYTPADIETLSGPATQKISTASSATMAISAIGDCHRYRRRTSTPCVKSRAYRERTICYQKTKPVQVSIGERPRPDPQGRPGYLRIDTVHPGDRDGVKGVYHLNAVDEVTQWQVVGAAAQTTRLG
jgi:hypothetical protein